MSETKVGRRGRGEDAIYFAAAKNRHVGSVSLDYGPRREADPAQGLRQDQAGGPGQAQGAAPGTKSSGQVLEHLRGAAGRRRLAARGAGRHVRADARPLPGPARTSDGDDRRQATARPDSNARRPVHLLTQAAASQARRITAASEPGSSHAQHNLRGGHPRTPAPPRLGRGRPVPGPIAVASSWADMRSSHAEVQYVSWAGFASPARTKCRRMWAQQNRLTRPSALFPAEV